MHRRPLLAALVLTVALAAGAAAQAWKKYTSAESGFSVTVPGTPKYEKRTTNSQAGALVLHNYSVARENDTIAYLVNRTDYPAAISDANSPERLLDLARDGQINSLQAKIRSEKRLKVSGYPARELIFDSARGLTGHARLVLAKNRLYQVLGLATQGKARGAQLGRFVTSFALAPPPKGKPRR